MVSNLWPLDQEAEHLNIRAGLDVIVRSPKGQGQKAPPFCSIMMMSEAGCQCRSAVSTAESLGKRTGPVHVPWFNAISAWNKKFGHPNVFFAAAMS